MIYVDTSVIAAALTNETETGRMQGWLGGQHSEELAISDWVVTEFSSALSIKLRSGQIEPEHRASTLTVFRQLSANSFNVLAVSNEQFNLAARFADQYETGIRAGDALHLAIAASHAATLGTLDKRLAEAGLALGVKTQIL